MGFIFDNIGYTGLFENAVQNGLGQTPGYANVGLVGTGCAVVGCKTSNDERCDENQ